jgi:hypothetical protein
MKVYSTTAVGLDGAPYNVRFLLEPAELLGLQRAGIIGVVDEVLGMQDLADALVADMEKQMHTAAGGLTQ